MSGPRLAGQRAVVTGASRGLGRAIARAFAAEGAEVLLVARSLADLQGVIAELPPGIGQAAVADLGRAEGREIVAARALAGGTAPDILVNNAAIQGPIGPLWENNPTEWARTLEVNLIAVADLCRRLLPTMLARGRGKIISLSGGGATGPRARFSAYAAAKAGLVRLTETLAAETKGRGIDVNAVAPGAMPTRMLREVAAAGDAAAGAAERASAEKVLASGGPAMERAAALCVFLASAASDGISGRLLSAVWDPWEMLAARRDELADTDIYTLRRIVPADRGKNWGEPRG